MGSDASPRLGRGLVRVCLAASIVLLVLSVTGLALAATWPLGDLAASGTLPARGGGSARPAPTSGRDTGALAAALAGRRFIRPPQIQPAVKDTGLAKRLLTKLKLVGIVSTDGTARAYVSAQQGDVQTVAAGDALLDFTVVEIGSSYVKLELDGVPVKLTY